MKLCGRSPIRYSLLFIFWKRVVSSTTASNTSIFSQFAIISSVTLFLIVMYNAGTSAGAVAAEAVHSRWMPEGEMTRDELKYHSL